MVGGDWIPANGLGPIVDGATSSVAKASASRPRDAPVALAMSLRRLCCVLCLQSIHQQANTVVPPKALKLAGDTLVPDTRPAARKLPPARPVTAHQWGWARNIRVLSSQEFLRPRFAAAYRRSCSVSVIRPSVEPMLCSHDGCAVSQAIDSHAALSDRGGLGVDQWL